MIDNRWNFLRKFKNWRQHGKYQKKLRFDKEKKLCEGNENKEKENAEIEEEKETSAGQLRDDDLFIGRKCNPFTI